MMPQGHGTGASADSAAPPLDDVRRRVTLYAFQREPAGQLGLAPQTAWTMRHKIMQAMARREDELVLLGLIEMDESYVGGKRQGKRGRGAEGSLLPE